MWINWMNVSASSKANTEYKYKENIMYEWNGELLNLCSELLSNGWARKLLVTPVDTLFFFLHDTVNP